MTQPKSRIVLLGPPASGKGTQAERIEAAFRLRTISPGAMLREEKAAGTPLGMEADRLTAGGNLLPDHVISGLVAAWLDRNADAHGFVFDGYPRTLGQAADLEAMLAGRGTALHAAIFLDIPEQHLVERIRQRVFCPSCKRVFAVGWQVASHADPCPACGAAPLLHRADDTVETLARRLQEYRQKTLPLLDFYEKRALLFRLDAARPAADVFASIRAVLESPADA